MQISESKCNIKVYIHTHPLYITPHILAHSKTHSFISEQIVGALIEMDCPFRLKPHQIQGLKLNCKPLFPIIQWLVKSVIDYRRITGDTTRNYSTFLFDASTIDLSNNYLDQRSKDEGRDFLINNVCSNYQLKRQFSKQSNVRFNSKESYVDATLLEYGFNFRAHIAFGTGDVDENTQPDTNNSAYPEASDGNKLQKKYGNLMNKIGGGDQQKTKKKKDEKSDDVDENMETAEEEEKRLKGIRTKMMESESDKKNVSGSALVEIIDREAVQDGKADYNEQDVLKQAMDLQQNDKEFVYIQRKKNLEARYKALSAEKKAKIEAYKEENDKMETLDEELTEISERNAKIDQMIKQLEIEEDKVENKEILQKLKQLVQKNEAIKRQQEVFKKECIEQQEVFKKKRLSLDEIKDNDEEIERIKKIENLYRNDLKKYDKIRGLLAEKNQEMSRVSRKLESYPTRSELLQYEKRFVELYNLTNERLKETKKYYHLYNSLNDSSESMNNEVNLLQKIQSEFPKRCKNEEDRKTFISSMDKMIDSLKVSSEAMLQKLQSVKNEKDEQSAKYNELLNYQRKYYKYVKEFQNACNINSQLSDRIDIVEAQMKETNE